MAAQADLADARCILLLWLINEYGQDSQSPGTREFLQPATVNIVRGTPVEFLPFVQSSRSPRPSGLEAGKAFLPGRKSDLPRRCRMSYYTLLEDTMLIIRNLSSPLRDAESGPYL